MGYFIFIPEFAQFFGNVADSVRVGISSNLHNYSLPFLATAYAQLGEGYLIWVICRTNFTSVFIYLLWTKMCAASLYVGSAEICLSWSLPSFELTE